MTKRKKRIEAWAIADNQGLHWDKMYCIEPGLPAGYASVRAIRLVEHSPATDAVVRAAIAYVEWERNTALDTLGNGEYERLRKAVIRLEKERAK